jgi:Meckel syndrome type 1 protein
MTELRDARLKRALQAAPDGGAEPAASTREAIRYAARRAVAPARKESSGWRGIFMPQSRMPWNAAFASLMLAVVVGVMWHGKEAQEPGGEIAAAPTATTAESVGAAASAATDAPSTRAAEEAQQARAPLPRASAPMVAGHDATREKATGEARAKGNAARVSRAAPTAPALADARSAPRQENIARRDAAAAASVEGRAAAAAAPPLSAAAPSFAPSAQSRVAEAAAPAPAWTELRITSGERSAIVSRAQAAELASLVTQHLAARERREAQAMNGDVRIEVMRAGERVAVIDVGPDPSALREHALRLLPR